LFKKHQPAALLLGGAALREQGLKAAARVAAATGCALICETFPARLERGPGLPALQRLPYFPDQAIGLLSQFKGFVRAGAKDPVSFFGYPGIPSRLLSAEQEIEVLAEPAEDVIASLEALADELDAPAAPAQRTISTPARPTGPISLEGLARAIASVQPEGAIIMDEGNTSAAAYFAISTGAPSHSYLTLTGGSIGQGMPCSIGAAIACPDRPVINIQADGAGLYTLQALWTQAREGLNVTTLLCSNRSYRVLGVELARAGIKQPGPQTRSLIDLSNPAIDWVQLAGGMGVHGVRVDTADDLTRELERSLAEPGPVLIEVVL
jgi:acetolactate synthase-1/2/3 large subunit